MAQLLQNSTIGGKQIASEEFVNNKVKTVTQLPGDYIQSDLSVKHIIALTQAEYDVISEKDAQTLYFIKQV